MSGQSSEAREHLLLPLPLPFFLHQGICFAFPSAVILSEAKDLRICLCFCLSCCLLAVIPAGDLLCLCLCLSFCHSDPKRSRREPAFPRPGLPASDQSSTQTSLNLGHPSRCHPPSDSLVASRRFECEVDGSHASPAQFWFPQSWLSPFPFPLLRLRRPQLKKPPTPVPKPR